MSLEVVDTGVGAVAVRAGVGDLFVHEGDVVLQVDLGRAVDLLEVVIARLVVVNLVDNVLVYSLT